MDTQTTGQAGTPEQLVSISRMQAAITLRAPARLMPPAAE